jgi:DNA polymerase-3 subunit beta
MRFTITRENLQQGLGAVAGSIPSRTTLPVLSNILIEAEDGAVRMSGTDLDTAVSVRVAADVAEAGAITAPAKKLQEIARELPGAVEFNTQGDAIQITSGRTRYRLNGLPKDEFPAFPNVDFAESWRVTEVVHCLRRRDGTRAVSVRAPAEVAEPGAITAPAKKLQEIARHRELHGRR